MGEFLSLRLALRFLRSRRYGPLARFMSAASTAGIAIGVCALIIGLSAMNGFERELENRILAVLPSGQIKSTAPSFINSGRILETIRSAPGIKAAAPVVELEGVLARGRNFAPAAVLGIYPEQERLVSAFEQYLEGGLEELKAADAEGAEGSEGTERNDESAAIIGAGIARKLGLKKGDHFQLMLSQNNGGTSLPSRPLAASIKVAGFFRTGGQTDSGLVFMHADQAAQLAGLSGPNCVHVRTQTLLASPIYVTRAAAVLDERARATSWTQSQGKLYNDIQLVRAVMYLAMIMVMAVACFNIVANLIMSVSEKSREIAILLTMGAGRGLIVRIFCQMGLLAALRGTLIGTVCGCAIAAGLTPLTRGLESLLGIKFLNADLYFIDFIPSELKLSDLLLVICCSVVMSLAASTWPALRAAAVKPALELNF